MVLPTHKLSIHMGPLQMMWCMPVSHILGSLRQEGHKFRPRITLIPCLTKEPWKHRLFYTQNHRVKGRGLASLSSISYLSNLKMGMPSPQNQPPLPSNAFPTSGFTGHYSEAAVSLGEEPGPAPDSPLNVTCFLFIHGYYTGCVSVFCLLA